MNKVKIFLKNNWFYLIGAFIGGLAGYLYWIYVGCETGTCPITASPIRTTLYGALMGALAFSLFKNNKKEEKKE